jgi:hypothetical protein
LLSFKAYRFSGALPVATHCFGFHNLYLSDLAKACLAAAKTIINEIKQELPDESPILWTTQAFSVAAAVSIPRE